MNTYYKNDLKKTYLILDGMEGEQEDYQTIMLRECEIQGLLRVEIRYIDNQTQYQYDISGKTAFKTLYEKMNLNYEEMKRLVENLLHTIQTIRKYMLDANCILLEPEYIFCDSKGFYFCYYPACRKDAKKMFHQLTEFFVRQVDYKDDEGVHFAYTLHKKTMEENYSIGEIMQALMPQENPEPQEEMEVEVMDYAEQMEKLRLEENCVEEKNDLWEPVRKLLERAKRRRMGYGEQDL